MLIPSQPQAASSVFAVLPFIEKDGMFFPKRPQDVSMFSTSCLREHMVEKSVALALVLLALHTDTQAKMLLPDHTSLALDLKLAIPYF